ncbi:hypothetical protein NLML1_0707 [Candidatus Nanosynbacter lyticus]|nr:hypothetical protein NLML1_0707 [Candidatus Nanosynbacter lyticus]
MPGTKHITHTIHHRQMIYLYTIVCVYLTLPILICIGVIPWNMKFVALVFGVVAMYIVMRILGHTHSDIGIPRHPQPYTTRTTATPSAGAWRSSRPFWLCTYHLRRRTHRCYHEHCWPCLVPSVPALIKPHRCNDKSRGAWCDDDCPGDY